MASPPQTTQGLSIRVGTASVADPELIVGPLAIEHTDELALGAPDDYGIEDVLALGEDDGESPVFGLSFGERDDDTDWGVAEIQDLVVNEAQGHFSSDDDARNDAMVMEAEWDPDDEVVMAVWAPAQPGGPMQLAPRIRRRHSHSHLLPYGLIAAGLGAASILGLVGIAALALVTVMATHKQIVVPLDRSRLPKVEIQRKEIVPQTPEEILEEVLGDEAEREQ